MPAAPALLLHPHCQLGENPLWRAEDGCLYWEDIPGGRIHRLHLETRRHEVVYCGEPVGGFTFQADGDLLLFRVNDLARLKPDGRLEVLRRFDDAGSARFNDVIADPEGRVFAGTIGRTAQSGGLFRVERDGTITPLFRGTGCSNGMGFSPDGRVFYWTCSTTRRLYAFDYDRATGNLARRRLLYEAADAEGIPDGLAVAADGGLWSARWDGFALVHHAPDGRVRERLVFPVARVSSACFGGADLDRLFVTTAGGRPEGSTLDGALFELTPGCRGLTEFRSAIGL